MLTLREILSRSYVLDRKEKEVKKKRFTEYVKNKTIPTSYALHFFTVKDDKMEEELEMLLRHRQWLDGLEKVKNNNLVMYYSAIDLITLLHIPVFDFDIYTQDNEIYDVAMILPLQIKDIFNKDNEYNYWTEFGGKDMDLEVPKTARPYSMDQLVRELVAPPLKSTDPLPTIMEHPYEYADSEDEYLENVEFEAERRWKESDKMRHIYEMGGKKEDDEDDDDRTVPGVDSQFDESYPLSSSSSSVYTYSESKRLKEKEMFGSNEMKIVTHHPKYWSFRYGSTLLGRGNQRLQIKVKHVENRELEFVVRVEGWKKSVMGERLLNSLKRFNNNTSNSFTKQDYILRYDECFSEIFKTVGPTIKMLVLDVPYIQHLKCVIDGTHPKLSESIRNNILHAALHATTDEEMNDVYHDQYVNSISRLYISTAENRGTPLHVPLILMPGDELPDIVEAYKVLHTEMSVEMLMYFASQFLRHGTEPDIPKTIGLTLKRENVEGFEFNSQKIEWKLLDDKLETLMTPILVDVYYKLKDPKVAREVARLSDDSSDVPEELKQSAFIKYALIILKEVKDSSLHVNKSIETETQLYILRALHVFKVYDIYKDHYSRILNGQDIVDIRRIARERAAFALDTLRVREIQTIVEYCNHLVQYGLRKFDFLNIYEPGPGEMYLNSETNGVLFIGVREKDYFQKQYRLDKRIDQFSILDMTYDDYEAMISRQDSDIYKRQRPFGVDKDDYVKV